MKTILSAVFRSEKDTVIYTRTIHQYDRGVVIRVSGIALPEHYQAHFSNSKDDGVGHSILVSGSDIPIPDVYLETGKYLYVWLYMATEHNEKGATAYEIVVPVDPRPAFVPLDYSGDIKVVADYDEDDHALVFRLQ